MMKEQDLSLEVGNWGRFINFENKCVKNKHRVAIFGSAYRGNAIIKNLLHNPEVEIVGIATDDLGGKISKEKRLWKYHTHEESELLVQKTKDIAIKNTISYYSGAVKNQTFYDILENKWKPTLVLMATFGQRINEQIFNFPKLGMYNLHPSNIHNEDKNLQFRGGDPFGDLYDSGNEKVTYISLHKVDKLIDNGEMVLLSDEIPLKNRNTKRDFVIEAHKTTSPFAALLSERFISNL